LSKNLYLVFRSLIYPFYLSSYIKFTVFQPKIQSKKLYLIEQVALNKSNLLLEIQK